MTLASPCICCPFQTKGQLPQCRRRQPVPQPRHPLRCSQRKRLDPARRVGQPLLLLMSSKGAISIHRITSRFVGRIIRRMDAPLRHLDSLPSAEEEFTFAPSVARQVIRFSNAKRLRESLPPTDKRARINQIQFHITIGCRRCPTRLKAPVGR